MRPNLQPFMASESRIHQEFRMEASGGPPAKDVKDTRFYKETSEFGYSTEIWKAGDGNYRVVTGNSGLDGAFIANVGWFSFVAGTGVQLVDGVWEGTFYVEPRFQYHSENFTLGFGFATGIQRGELDMVVNEVWEDSILDGSDWVVDTTYDTSHYQALAWTPVLGWIIGLGWDFGMIAPFASLELSYQPFLLSDDYVPSSVYNFNVSAFTLGTRIDLAKNWGLLTSLVGQGAGDEVHLSGRVGLSYHW